MSQQMYFVRAGVSQNSLHLHDEPVSESLDRCTERPVRNSLNEETSGAEGSGDHGPAGFPTAETMHQEHGPPHRRLMRFLGSRCGFRLDVPALGKYQMFWERRGYRCHQHHFVRLHHRGAPNRRERGVRSLGYIDM
jgi:hypothetical protein